MKTSIFRFAWPLVALFTGLFLGGCQTANTTASNSPSNWAIFAAGGLTFGIDEALPLVLDKNPNLAPIVSAVAAALPTVFGDGDLTPKGVEAAITSLSIRYPELTPTIQKLLVDVINKAVVAYETAFKVQVANATDPNVKEIISGIAAGLNAGLKAWQGQSGAPAPATAA